MSYTIQVVRENEVVSRFMLEQGQSVLKASEYNLQKTIEIGCRGGGCGRCKVTVVYGQYESKVMSKAHIGEFEKNNNIVLACRIFPLSDMELCVQSKVSYFCRTDKNN